MRLPFRLFVMAALWLGVAAPALAKPDLLIVISIDGFRADYLSRGKTPTIAALAAAGVTAPMRPSFPSLTFPNHYTLVTGLRPDRHGIVNNVMDVPGLGHFTMASSADPRWWNGGEPLWVTASRQGLKTATLFWPGADHPIRGRQADLWKPYDKVFLADQRVDQVFGWLDAPEAERPSFVTLYFDLVDTVGHESGPNSAEVDRALESTDASVGRLVEGLKARGLYEHANLIVTADHGMADVSTDRMIFLDDIAPADSFEAVTVGTSAGLRLAAGAPKDTRRKLLALRGHARCWPKADLPKALRYGRSPRVPPVVCVADVGWFITTHARMTAEKGPFEKGAHGYDPAAPEMAALFVAEGPAFERGARLPTFDNVDVQPLMARLLGLKVPKGDGSAKPFDIVLSMH